LWLGQALNCPPKPFGLPQSLEVVKANGDLAVLAFPGFPDFIGNPDLVAKSDNAARTLIFKRIRREQQEFSGPTFIGELGEAVRGIRSAGRLFATGLRKYLKDVQLGKAKFRRAPKRNALEFLSDRWLEFSFGAQPLLSDIDSAMNALARFNEEKTRRTRFSASGIAQDLAPFIPDSSLTLADWLQLFYKVDRVDECLTRYKVGMQADLSWGSPGIAAQISKAQQLFGFNLSEFAPTLWEVCPWSFFIDYFTNVGDIVAAGATDTARVSWVSRTLRQSTYYKTALRANDTAMRATHGTDYVLPISFSGSGVSKCETVRLQRFANTFLAVPTLEFSIPGKPAQWANMLALKAGGANFLPFWSKT
jgi:hypothetical protein